MDSKAKARLAARIGSRLAFLRTEAGITQAWVAEHVGIGDEAVSRFERGVAIPTLPRLYELADALDVRVDELLLDASPRPSDQAAWIASRIAQLPKPDRDFVAETVERLAAHMRQKPAGKRPRR